MNVKYKYTLIEQSIYAEQSAHLYEPVYSNTFLLNCSTCTRVSYHYLHETLMYVPGHICHTCQYYRTVRNIGGKNYGESSYSNSLSFFSSFHSISITCTFPMQMELNSSK